MQIMLLQTLIMKNNFSVRGKFFLYMYPTYKQRTGFTIHHSLSWSQDSSVSIMTTLQTGEPEFDFWKGQGIFCHHIQTSSGAHPSPYPVGSGALSLEVVVGA
jgi:hypothetical protein